MDGECSYSCAISSKGIFKDITRKVERDTFPDLKKAPVSKKQKYVPSTVEFPELPGFSKKVAVTQTICNEWF